MPTLYLVDGAAGSGKSDFIEYCSDDSANDVFIKKYTTKSKDSDGIVRNDLEYCTKEKYAEKKNGLHQGVDYFEYKYPLTDNSNRYLVLKKDIDERLRKYRNVYLIIRNIDTLKEIKRAYANFLNINIVTIYIYCDSERLRERVELQCKEQNITDASTIASRCDKRLARNAECLKSYIDAISDKLYDYVILNDISKEEYHACLDNIRNSCNEKNDLHSELKAFIIMPMTEDREWVHFNEVKKAIYKGAKREGFLAERQDDKIHSDIIHGIRDSIESATVCIADITLARPNCYYEIGLSDALHNGEQIMFIKQEGEETEFDLKNRHCTAYTFHQDDYSRISNIIARRLELFKKHYIFMTDGLDAYINRIRMLPDK